MVEYQKIERGVFAKFVYRIGDMLSNAAHLSSADIDTNHLYASDEGILKNSIISQQQYELWLPGTKTSSKV